MAILNREQVRQAIASLEPFKGSNIRGTTYSLGMGLLRNQNDVDQFYDDLNSNAVYFVYSYDTPIAWYRSDTGWYRVKQKFSVTTSKQMGLIPTDGSL